MFVSLFLTDLKRKEVPDFTVFFLFVMRLLLHFVKQFLGKGISHSNLKKKQKAK